MVAQVSLRQETRLARRAWVAGALVAAFACHQAPQPPEDRPARTIHYAAIGAKDFGDVPSRLAHRRLRAAGYRVEERTYAATDLAIEALSMGGADFSEGALTTVWMAASRGARVRTLMDHKGNPHRLVVTSGVATCADLDGRRLALQAESAAGSAMVRAYLAEDCRAARPIILFVPDSENRAASLLAGGSDAAMLQVDSLDWLEDRAPGRFHVLSDFARRWPVVKATGVHVNTDFAATHREIVVDYIRARLTANQDVSSNAELLAAEATQVLGPSDRWPRLARAYVEARSWPADGGLSEASVRATLTFFFAKTKAPTPVSADSVVDLTFLKEALESTKR